jgi:hypothetical protein
MTPPRRRWFRFSLRTLFVVVTLLGIWLGFYSVAPSQTIVLSIALFLFSLVGCGTLWAICGLLCPESKAPPQV